MHLDIRGQPMGSTKGKETNTNKNLEIGSVQMVIYDSEE